MPRLYQKIGYLRKDRREKFVCGGGRPTRAWFVNAWRIVDLYGKDLVQPWAGSKKEARDIAKALKIYLNEEPLKVTAVYDNGGKTADRYSVYFNDVDKLVYGVPHYMCLCMSAEPYHPQGVGMHGSGVLGRHNGKRIPFEALPKDCQRAVKHDLKTH